MNITFELSVFSRGCLFVSLLFFKSHGLEFFFPLLSKVSICLNFFLLFFVFLALCFVLFFLFFDFSCKAIISSSGLCF